MAAKADWTDRKIEETVGNLLRAGVLLSAVVVLTGGVIYLFRHGFSPADYSVFRGEPPDYKSLPGIFRGAMAVRGRAIIQLGLVLLILTPVARVAFSIIGFMEEEDHMYTSFTIFVLVILLYSLLGAGSAF
jgi:uncharacterized membrane protein